MTRKFIINGETLVSVKGPSGSSIAEKTSLGLTDRDGQIRVMPRIVHQDMQTDSYGPNIPPDVLFMSMDCIIRMTLVHFDWDVFNQCLSLSAASSLFSGDGGLAGAGTPLGAGLSMYEEGNNLISLYLSSPVLNDPWKFYATYIINPTPQIPLGTKRTLMQLEWRAIPYKALSASSTARTELISSGAVLYDSSTD